MKFFLAKMNFSLTFLIFLCLLVSTNVLARKAYDLVRFGACREYSDLPLNFEGFKKHTYSQNNRSIEINMNLKKEIKDMWATVNMFKCDTDGRPDSCEYFVKDFKIEGVCEKIDQQGQVWTNFVEGIQPKLTCPVKPTVYKVKSSLGKNLFQFFPVPTGMWKVKGLMYQGRELLTCVNFEMKVIEVRRN